MYYIEVQNPQSAWRDTGGSYTRLLMATSEMGALVDSGCRARVVDGKGNVFASEIPHGAEVVWDDNYIAPSVRESGIVYRGT